MFETISTTIALTVSATGGGGVQPAPPSPPPVKAGGTRPKRVSKLISWDASEITCDNGVTFAGETIPRRVPVRTFRAPADTPRVMYTFTIGADGRALSIDEAKGYRMQRYGTDIAPAIAAAKFSPQAQPTQCEVTFTQTQTPTDQATLTDMMTLLAQGSRTRFSREQWERVVPGDCSRKRKRPLEIHTPDYRKLPKIPGANNWTFLTHDIDEKGEPFDIKTMESTGAGELDAASRKAVADSRWVDEDPREGCWRYDYTAAAEIEAPKPPDMSDFGEWPDACEADDKWARPPVLAYPKPFEKRGIEGWAIFRYDVASWGEIGNVELLAAQPAAAFSQAAERVLKSAEYKPREGGLTGCVEKVSFRLAGDGGTSSEIE